jgi:hypothetical protein
VTAAACGGSVVTTNGNEDSGSDAASISRSGSPPGNFAVPYGLPPMPDGGSIGIGATDAGAADAAQQDVTPRDAEGRDIILLPPPPPYGAPPVGM